MGLPIRELHLTNTGDESRRILLSKWIPIKEGPGKYKMPPDTPIGYDIWVPNLVGLTEDMGTVKVELIESEEETGIWLMCFDDYFGDEDHIFVDRKPEWILDKEGKKKSVRADHYNSLHVTVPFKTKHGDGPINIGFRLIGNKKKENSLWQKVKDIL